MVDYYRYLGFHFLSVIEPMLQRSFTSVFTIQEIQSPDPKQESPPVQIFPSSSPTSCLSTPRSIHYGLPSSVDPPPNAHPAASLNLYTIHHKIPPHPQSNPPVHTTAFASHALDLLPVGFRPVPPLTFLLITSLHTRSELHALLQTRAWFRRCRSSKATRLRRRCWYMSDFRMVIVRSRF